MLTLGDGHFMKCGVVLGVVVTGMRVTCVPLWLMYSNHRFRDGGIPPRNLMLEARAEALGAARGLCLMKNDL